jgi:hypothetical protein
MANIATYAENFLLAYLLLGATATRPQAWGIGLSLASPTSVSGSEIASGTGVVRSSGQFSSANINTFVNTVANTYGPVNAAGSYSGIIVKDSLPASYTADQGNLLLFGLLATARTVGSGDSLVLASSALTISLS